MSRPAFNLDSIDEGQKTPLVVRLIHYARKLLDQIQRLKEEVARLKRHKGKPQIPPSCLERDPSEVQGQKPSAKRPGSEKRSKTKELTIHETICIAPENVPAGSTREGHDEWVVQGLVIQAHNVRYELECWRTPEGALIKGKLPDGVDGHFDADLRRFVLYQRYHVRATQPVLLEQLRELGVDISAGQVNRVLTEAKEEFHREKAQVLAAGLEVSRHVHVDDTGARHAGKNGYCTHIGNELFAWFQSTPSKSRINFLGLLNTGHPVCALTEDAFEYIEAQSFPKPLLATLRRDAAAVFNTREDWAAYLNRCAILDDRHVRIATEGAMLAGLLLHGLSRDLVVVSDDAGQFNVLVHALCWVHAERTIHKLVPGNLPQTRLLEEARDNIWKFYRQLKDYKIHPDPQLRAHLEAQFDALFRAQTDWDELDAAMGRIAKNKEELLLVLERPHVPLNNNLSERDIRERAQTRKASGGTRSNDGRACRDTFSSLKKTCRKLAVSFWEYLYDRLAKQNTISPLPDLIRARAQSG